MKIKFNQIKNKYEITVNTVIIDEKNDEIIVALSPDEISKIYQYYDKIQLKKNNNIDTDKKAEEIMEAVLGFLTEKHMILPDPMPRDVSPIYKELKGKIKKIMLKNNTEDTSEENIIDMRYIPILGPNTNQWWIYDEADDVYIEPPTYILKNIKKLPNEEEQEKYLLDVLKNQENKWLKEKSNIYEDIEP